MGESICRFDGVSFRFPEDALPALENISFTVHRGERLVLTGPSGCGKSTLLFLLNRLYPYNCDGIVTGSMRLFGSYAEDYAPGQINRRIATVFQDPDSQFCMPTVEQELAFTLENLHTPAEGMEALITETLEITGLADIRHSVIQTLSGGMKQRVATACALIMKPELLLLDEPIAHLDPYTASQFIAWLDALQKTQGWTIVAVEHRIDLWDSFFDREISMSADGKIIDDGPFLRKQNFNLPKRVSSASIDEVLTAENIAVAIKDKTILHPASFNADVGEIIVVAGPNGSGKSTLLKAMCGIHRLKSGKLDSPGLGFVPQTPDYLFLTQSVKDELTFSGTSSSSEISQLQLRLRLDELSEAHPFAISHGQKRRVAIGAMLADKRQVLLMDEPTSGQDAAALGELAKLIDQRAQEGITFFIATHDMEFAAALADSILLIKEGRITGKFPAASVWNDPALLATHHLIAPRGAVSREKRFA
ncbi:MAG TPA: ATP-binding cassette domain-containing protein [Planococcus sp. (in: firmicutes)]|nr:ATP-binding cassette domain-containing protein [Planococcus sp. (in: firmicutes)]